MSLSGTISAEGLTPAAKAANLGQIITDRWYSRETMSKAVPTADDDYIKTVVASPTKDGTWVELTLDKDHVNLNYGRNLNYTVTLTSAWMVIEVTGETKDGWPVKETIRRDKDGSTAVQGKIPFFDNLSIRYKAGGTTVSNLKIGTGDYLGIPMIKEVTDVKSIASDIGGTPTDELAQLDPTGNTFIRTGRHSSIDPHNAPNGTKQFAFVVRSTEPGHGIDNATVYREFIED